VPRPTKCRWVGQDLDVTYFKPKGVPLRQLAEVRLTVEELEAVRLKDVEGLEQQACAERMRVSRPTFHRVLQGARHKIALALTQGMAIRIAGGHHQYYRDGRAAETGTDEEAGRMDEATGTEEARVAVSAKGGELDSPVDERFGWCPYFVVADRGLEEGATAAKNPAVDGSGGAGIAAAQFLDSLGVRVVLTGSLGPNAARIAQAAGIRAFAAPSGVTVREALAAWRRGDLKQL